MSDTRHVKANIEAIGKELEMLPEVGDEEREVSTREAVSALAPQIRGLREKGYSLERVSQLLTERGMAITVHTLRGYLRSPKQKRRKAVTTTGVRTEDGAAAVSAVRATNKAAGEKNGAVAPSKGAASAVGVAVA